MHEVTNTRLQKIKYKLQNYNFILKYEPGKTNHIADLLSHDPRFSTENAPKPDRLVVQLSDTKSSDHEFAKSALPFTGNIDIINRKYKDLEGFDQHIIDLKDSTNKEYNDVAEIINGNTDIKLTKNNQLYNQLKDNLQEISLLDNDEKTDDKK